MMPNAELREMMVRHVASLRSNAAKCRERCAELDAAKKNEDATIAALTFSREREGLEASAARFERRADAIEYLSQHLAADEGFRMNATEMLAFRTQFAVEEANIQRLALDISEAPKEVENHSSLITRLPNGLYVPGQRA